MMNRSPCNIIIDDLSDSSISKYEGKFWGYYIGYIGYSLRIIGNIRRTSSVLFRICKMDIYKACNISSDKQRDSARSIRCVSIAFRRLFEDVSPAIYDLFTVLKKKKTVLLIAYIIEKQGSLFSRKKKKNERDAISKRHITHEAIK